jgi:chromosome segregation protein
MRLKSIKLSGFKSFVDPTNVNFPSNLCAVVGPNGCGKSNVIDAVRWVMGETSAKNLRGESMSDVIFNGSSERKPVGQASVELIFDNSEGRVAGEFAAYSEIGIRRKVTRDGQSNYYLNGNKCRRRDITDIFLGTGLGPKSYAIIEQGMISRLIESKPDELRIYIEEAAGISKYKERRRETENRISRTVENLERLTDIRDELARQINRLERQAKAAEKYSEFKKDERRLSNELLALKWREHNNQATKLKAIVGSLEVEKEKVLSDKTLCDSQIETFRTQFTDQSDAFNEAQRKFYKIGSEISRIEQSIEHAQQRAQDLDKELDETKRNFQETETHLTSDLRKIEGWEAELKELKPAIERAELAEVSSVKALEDAEVAMNVWQQAWDDFNQNAISPRQQAEVQQSRIQYLEQLMRKLSERHQNLEAEAESFQANSMEEEMLTVQKMLNAAELELIALETNRDDNGNEIKSLRVETNVCRDEHNNLLGKHRALVGRRASLRALQQAAMGDDTERKWLTSKGLDKFPRLSEQVKPSLGWEVAVEAVMGSYLQAITVENMSETVKLMEEFAKGELLLISKSRASSKQNGSKGRLLSDLVEGEAVKGLLENIYAVENLADALSMQSMLSANESVVTSDGIWLGPNWARVARDKDAAAGVLQRKQELKIIDKEIEVLDLRVRKSGVKIDRNEEKLQSLELAAHEISKAIASQQSNYAELRSKLSGFEVQIQQYHARKERAEKELAQVDEQTKSEQENLSSARISLQDSIQKMEVDNVTRENLISQRDKLKSILDSARSLALEDRENRQELTVRETSLKTQLSSIKDSASRLEIQLQRLGERRSELMISFEIKEDPADSRKEDLEKYLLQRSSAEKELSEARKELEDVEYHRSEVEKQRGIVEVEQQRVQNELETQRLLVQEIITLSRAIEEQIKEKRGNLEILLESLSDESELVDWEEQLQLLANRIQRLGPINLAAIDEYKVESERKEYLDKQNAELESALETLQSAIRKIDKETRTRFKETFELVNTHIQALFPKLFGGGHAYLEMTGDDLLNTGVSLMARPPGKKNSSIHLLSGGEKALTAIAMVFAIFKLNPAPFCMLDEVDAPLDDANVSRYAKMVKEMSEQVQFIFITHNKISMEAANQLMGVTMHEAGVSRLVSVDVDQAAELAEA